jgi:hypothetical protein
LSIVVTAAALASGASAGGTPSDRRVKACESAGTTVAANGVARVFRQRRGKIPGYYACRFGTRRARFLESYDRDGGGGVGRIQLTGARVAFDYLVCSRGGPCTGSVRVVHLRSGMTRRSETPPSDPDNPFSATSAATDLELTRRGSVAWLRPRQLATGTDVQVFKFERGSAAVLLDQGPAIDPRSLAVSGSTVYWIHDGQPRAAPIR